MKTITFKVTEEEDRVIRTQARRAKLTVSEYLRRKLRSDTRSSGSVDVAKSPATGAPAFCGDADMPPLNQDTVREMLSQFP